MITLRGRTTMQRVSSGLSMAAGSGALVRPASACCCAVPSFVAPSTQTSAPPQVTYGLRDYEDTAHTVAAATPRRGGSGEAPTLLDALHVAGTQWRHSRVFRWPHWVGAYERVLRAAWDALAVSQPGRRWSVVGAPP